MIVCKKGKKNYSKSEIETESMSRTRAIKKVRARKRGGKWEGE